MEHSQFVRGKDRAIDEYQAARKQLLSSIGGQNFSYEPGFCFDMQTELELKIKYKISDINYEILKESVARELKSKGVEHDTDYQAAVVRWELEKAELLSDWGKEVATIKHGQASEEAILNLLAIEISKRGNDLIAAKTAINLEIEDYRQQIAALDGTTGSYELTLAESKMLTARKKLEIIPYIQQLIDIETQAVEKELSLLEKTNILVFKEGGVVDVMRELAEKEREVANKESLLITQGYLLIAKEQELITKNEEMLQHKSALSDVFRQIVDKDGAIVGVDASVAELEKAVETSKTGYINLQAQVLDIKNTILGVDNQNLNKKEFIENETATLYPVKNNIVAKRDELITRQYEEIAKFPELIQIEKDLILKGLEVVTYLELLTTQQELLVDKESSEADKRSSIADKSIEISLLKEQEVIALSTLIPLESSVLALEGNIIDLKSSMISSALSLAGKREALALSADSALETKFDIVDMDSEITVKRGLVLDKELSVLDRDKDVIATLDEISITSRDIIAKQSLAIDAEANTFISYEELISIEDTISSLSDNIALVLKDVSTKHLDILSAKRALLDKSTELNLTKDDTITAKEKLIDKELDEQEEKRNLISVERETAEYSRDTLMPALETLIDKTAEYATALEVQTGIQDQVLIKRYEILDVLDQHMDEQSKTLDTKLEASSKLAELAGLMDALVNHKTLNLSPVISDLIVTYQSLFEQIPRQTESKIELSDISRQASESSQEYVDQEVVVAGLNNSYKELLSDLTIANIALTSQRSLNAVLQHDADSQNLIDYASKYVSTHNEILIQADATFNDVSNLRVINKEKDISINHPNDMLLEDARGNAVSSTGGSQVDRIREEANVRIAAKGITARLNHILTQD